MNAIDSLDQMANPAHRQSSVSEMSASPVSTHRIEVPAASARAETPAAARPRRRACHPE